MLSNRYRICSCTVRSERWKLHFPHPFVQPKPAGGSGKPGAYATPRIGRELFDLERDPGETANVADRHPDVVRDLEGVAARAREELGDSATGQKGRNTRPPGRVPPG